MKVSDNLPILNSESYYSNAKLLISGEYLVLEGALSLAVPLNLGQDLIVETNSDRELYWEALEPSGTWFMTRLSLPSFTLLETTDTAASVQLIKLLQAARLLNPHFLTDEKGFSIKTHLNFNRKWGLGSSSTLLTNLASWAEIDPFALHFATSTGSGYDIACAMAPGPILYQLNGGKPIIENIEFHPPFSHSIYFVYLGIKQDSNQGIHDYRKRVAELPGETINTMNALTLAMATCHSFNDFTQLVHEHETLMGGILNKPILNKTLFSGFPGAAKSLGAWGGDFAMVCSQLHFDDLRYELKKRGMETLFRFDDIVRKNQNL